MRKVTVALGSFVLGAACMSLLGNHTSTFAQAPPQKAPPQQGLITIAGTVPVVPPLPHVALEGNSFQDAAYVLDGLECRGCTFKNVTLTYGGGAYLLQNANVSLPVKLNLTGAALNTAQLLQTFGLIGCPAKAVPQMPNPNAPTIMMAKYAPTGSLESPVGVK
jgi:hypothetical protein